MPFRMSGEDYQGTMIKIINHHKTLLFVSVDFNFNFLFDQDWDSPGDSMVSENNVNR